MKAALHRLCDAMWYQGRYPALVAGLSPLASLYGLLSRRRRPSPAASRAPTVVVGNLTVGATGKTPLTMALAEGLAAAGWRPGIVSRGYPGRARRYPHRVRGDEAVATVGDEALLLCRAAPTVVDPRRARAAAVLAAECDVLISDDGLQHRALPRDLEIVVVDGARGFGNGRLLPAGPLRERSTRLAQVDWVVVHVGMWRDAEAFERAGAEAARWRADAVPMALRADSWVALPDGRRHALSGWRPDRPVHAVAGIGHPARFFDALRGLGLEVIEHPFPDHARLRSRDLDFGAGEPVVMTAKDAVRCRAFAPPNSWWLRVAAVLPETFLAELRASLSRLRRRAA